MSSASTQARIFSILAARTPSKVAEAPLTKAQIKSLVSGPAAAYRKAQARIEEVLEKWWPQFDFDPDEKILLKNLKVSPKKFLQSSTDPAVRQLQFVLFKSMDEFVSLEDKAFSAPFLTALLSKYKSLSLRFADVPATAWNSPRSLSKWLKQNPDSKFALRLLAAVEHGYAAGTSAALQEKADDLIENAIVEAPYDYRVYDNLVFVSIPAKEFLESALVQTNFTKDKPRITDMDWESLISFDEKAALDAFVSK